MWTKLRCGKIVKLLLGEGYAFIILIVLFIVSVVSAEVTNEKTITVEGVTIYDYGTAKDISETLGPVNLSLIHI